MTRSFLAGSFIMILLVGCRETAAHRPEIPFVFTVLNHALITDGKDTVTKPVEPIFAVNDIVHINEEGTPCRIIQMDSVSIKHILLPVPEYYIWESSKDPAIFKVYRSGDTLIFEPVDGLPYCPIPQVSNVYKDAKRAKAINLQTGEVICSKVEITRSVGDSIHIGLSDYKILKLEPYTDVLEIEFPEEIQAISNDPAHPDLMQAYSKGGEKIYLGYYHPKK